MNAVVEFCNENTELTSTDNKIQIINPAIKKLSPDKIALKRKITNLSDVRKVNELLKRLHHYTEARNQMKGLISITFTGNYGLVDKVSKYNDKEVFDELRISAAKEYTKKIEEIKKQLTELGVEI